MTDGFLEVSVTKIPWQRDRATVGVYQIALVEDPRNRVYVGSSKNVYARWVQHKKYLRQGRHHSRHLQRAWDKYGHDAFSFTLVERCAPELRCEREQAWIDRYPQEQLFNSSMTAGALRGYVHTPETRAKMSAAQMGNPSNTGRRLDADWKAHIAQGMAASDKKSAGMKGKEHTPATKAKMSADRTGIPKSAQHRARIAAGSATLSEQDVREIRRLCAQGAQKKALAEKYGVTPSCISGVARGRTWKHIL